jgi:DNA processing protein
MPLSDREALITLNLLPKIGPVRVRRLLDAFGSPAAGFQASRKDYLHVSGCGGELASILANWQDHADPTAEMQRVADFGAELLMRSDALYPRNLLEIYDPPLLLYVWGQITDRDQLGIAVVGSRRCTHYGLQCARKFSYQLASAGITVLSGFARGIDTAAHEGAVAAGGRTVAVLGSGLGQLYPPENKALAEKIVQGHGALVSEFPMQKAPDKQTFPQRNRIVSGWSSGLLVVESPVWSGSLITANLAAEQGRAVYAVPGPIDRPSSAGCHKLIQTGARLVCDAQDILDDLGQLFPTQPSLPGLGAPTSVTAAPSSLSQPEQELLLQLHSAETHFNELLEQCGQEIPDLIANLMRLELKGLIKQLPGKHYVRC